ncbi:YHS domain-containing (seleno)protein [Sneathiella glossodoripedis]|uniref:YHS domain-containing (seleno)protein n=1 Tax=Sneathiella glossodoripedis TaxID=418853 RepID=UPI0004718209|nr:YHS domain-containing (seleno)protein [Sneathiella glossodoripedis]
MIQKVLITAVCLLFSTGALAFEQINTGYFGNSALHGYDAPRYFSEAKAVEGDSNYEFEWKGALWQFADANSRDLFAANPEQYAPQYGGYCSNQMSLGNLSDIDPGVWLIHKGKLYFFGHEAGRKRWQSTGIDARIKDADKHWQALLAQE